MSKLYIIHKGKHRSNTHRFWGMKFKPMFGGNSVSGYLNLHENCQYGVPHNDTHINKLVGFTRGLDPHKNSARIGWRAENHKGRNVPVFYLYVYIDSVRIEKQIMIGEYTQHYYYYLYADRKTIYCEIMETNTGDIYTGDIYKTYIIEGFNPSILNYKLFPYFGGEDVAPHTMYMLI